MNETLDLEQFPLHEPQSDRYADLVTRCRADLVREGMFNLTGFLRPPVANAAAQALTDLFEKHAFKHTRRHNIYFRKDIEGLAPNHPALRAFETSNHTLCADQITPSELIRVYEWPPLRAFLALCMGKDDLHLMADPLARVNVMSYGAGEALNWHFDRSEFTTTLLLQAPQNGGAFEYRKDLRSDRNPNYDGVAKLLEGGDPLTRQITLSPGTLNVFQGKNTAHRVTPVGKGQRRVIAVFSYYERPGVQFSAEERIGFYGRAG